MASITRPFTAKAAGPIASALAFVLAVALTATWLSAQRNEARLERRIAALNQQLSIADAAQKAQVAACTANQEAMLLAVQGRKGDPAKRLLKPPPGYDVCARMENADQAVLDSLG